MRQPAKLLWAAILSAAIMLTSCQHEDCDVDAIAECYRQRIAQMPRPVQPRLARPTGATTRPYSSTQPDSGLEPRQAAAGIVQISLSDAIHRALCNSLDIKVESYSPGIAAMDIVAAEAAFDAVFFMNAQYSKLDQGSNGTAFGTGQSESRTIGGGFRKRLITGGEVSVTYQANRIRQGLPNLRFNPLWETDAVLELRQPLLEGFGTNVNKAQIRVNTNNRDISMYQFRSQVIRTLSDVEQAYWNLYFARQSLAIGQELLVRTERANEQVVARLPFDALPVNVSQTESAVATRRANVIRLANDVRDAEDQLKNLLNDPTVPLNCDIAIIPTTEPLTQPLQIDPQCELWAGLEHRPELQQARLNIANANISLEVARNATLPQLDLVLQWGLSGLNGNFPNSNEQLMHGDLQDYVAGVTFEVPLGERAAHANVRKSKLQIEQAAAAYHNAVADVMTQIQIALRDVTTSYREIMANQQAAKAANEQLASLVARRERLSPEYLNLELQAQETQANARRALEAAITNYNIAIIQLEQAKGTLLEYDQVQLAPGK